MPRVLPPGRSVVRHGSAGRSPALLVVLVGALALAGCAPEVIRRPTQLVASTEAGHPGGTLELLADAVVQVGVGYTRTLRRGSVWITVGRIAEGDVYRPVDQVLTVEGAHVHEAYLVLEDNRLRGFYLPVERAFSPAPDGPDTRLSIRRRSP
jgi:hypothetical protein